MFDVIINDILSNPAILIGLFVLTGNLLLKYPLPDVLSSTFKTIIGFTMLSLGAGIAAGTLDNFSAMFTEAFGVSAVVMNTDAYGALLNERFPLAPVIFISGMLLNLVIAKFTRFKYIYLTGHLALYMSAMLAMIFQDFPPVIAVGVSALLLSAYMALSPALIQPYTKQITGTDEFAVANSGSLNYFIAAKLGQKFGNKNYSTEEITVPSSLAFLKEPSVSMSLTMSFLFILVSFFTGSAFIETELSGGQNYLFFSFMQGIIFAAGIQVLITGITLAIDEIVPAFRGIAEKVIDGAIPGLDAPVMLKYAPNAMIIGFVVSLLAGIVGMFVLTVFSLPIIIPGMLQYFFVGGISAMYGNSTGGRRGALLGALSVGFLMSLLPSLFVLFVGNPADTLVFGDSDYTVWGLLVDSIANLFH